RVIISSNDPNAAEGWIDLVGRATASAMCDIHVQPAAIDFGSVPLAGFSNQIVTISNNGDSDCRISAINGPTGSPDFSLPTMPSIPMIVPPGEARQLTIQYHPAEVGSDQATLSLVCDNDSDEPVTDIPLTGQGIEPPPCDFQVDPSLLNFGVIPIGDRRELNARIWNFGSATCSIFDWSLTLDSAPDFIPSSLPFPQPSLAPGGFVDVMVAFEPQSPGWFDGTLEVRGGINALDVLIVNIGLSGAADPARMCIHPEVLPFTDVEVGSHSDLEFDITACGGADLKLRQITFDGVNPDFSFVSAPPVPFTLQSGQTLTVEIRYAPTDAGVDFGRVLVSGNDNDFPTGVVQLTGNYTGSCPSVFYCQPDWLVFPATDIGRSSVKTFVCINHGSETLTVTDVAKEAGTSAEFGLSAPGIPLLVPPDGELHVEVEYLPSDVGTDSGAVIVTSEFSSPGCDNFTLIAVPLQAEGKTPDLPECIEPAQFLPQLQFAWPNGNITNPQWVQVGMTPIVINLTDDNGDGQIDEGDVPDIAFNSFLGVQGVFDGILRVISGDDGHEIWTIPDLNLRTEYTTHLAAADIDGDNRPEVLALKLAPRDENMMLKQTGSILCFEDDGTLKWESEPWHGPTGYYEDLSSLGIADLDNDGHPEIFRGASVFDRHGHLLWEGTGGQGLIGAGSGVFSTAANLDGQGTMELVAGNTAYRSDGTIMWQAAVPDGLAAVVDFNLDGQPEVLLICIGLGGGVKVLDGQTGAVLASLADSDVNAILPPVIADIDGSGGPEVALTGVVAGQFYFWGLDVSEADFQISEIWSDLLADTTYGGGNTAFDFEGDGPFEVLQNGEKMVNIFSGLNHTQIYSAPRSSATYIEMPVVADVDNDGHAELVIVQNGGQGSLEYPPMEEGILVYGNLNDDWVATRRIWNQLDYHVSNVRENGTIPRFETPNWTLYNNFQTNEPFCE
ncbi:MAG: choice-of-anchor D domain-containing protein, partial [Deltaproteobacteria bacterium]|nr:choice-of-anchor D domain-containing protein [Deltaproteobacteria bacterium]